MKNYKLKIPIGELFTFLNIDNDLYNSFQFIQDRNIKVKTPTGEYTKILAFVKKRGWVRRFYYENGYIDCDEKHKVKQLDGSFKFIIDADHVLVNGNVKNILSNSNRRFVDVYDISLNTPHEYVTSGGVISHNTTAAKILINKIECDYMIINASDENGVDTIRDKIKNFASTQGFKRFKIILLDEADYLSQAGQAILRNLMETFSNHCRFILTCNYVEKIISPIQSRCQVFSITPPTKKDVAKQVTHILNSENVKFDIKDLVPIIDNMYPDIRKIINYCQQSTKKGVLTQSKENLAYGDFKTKLLDILKSTEGKPAKFMLIRQLVADYRIKDFSEIYTFLFKKLDEYAKDGTQGQTILVIQDSQYSDSFSVDKELCFMACIVKLLNI